MLRNARRVQLQRELDRAKPLSSALYDNPSTSVLLIQLLGMEPVVNHYVKSRDSSQPKLAIELWAG